MTLKQQIVTFVEKEADIKEAINVINVYWKGEIKGAVSHILFHWVPAAADVVPPLRESGSSDTLAPLSSDPNSTV